MNKSISTALVAAGAAAALLVVPDLARGDSLPMQTGCPAAFDLLSVSDLEAASTNYHLPAKLDDPANGGNGDGRVCGKAVNPQAAANFCNGPCDVPILYDFTEDDLTPSH